MQPPDFARHLHRGVQMLALPLLLTMPPAQAVGLAGYEVQSSLGQALRMVVQITARAGETVEAECFSINPRAFVNDGLPQLTGAQLTIDKDGNQQRLIVTSARLIPDPIVRVSIDVGCDAMLRRDLTLLPDPARTIEARAETTKPAIQAGVADPSRKAPRGNKRRR